MLILLSTYCRHTDIYAWNMYIHVASIVFISKKPHSSALCDDQVLVHGSLILCIFYLYNYRIRSEPVLINDLPVDSTYQKPQIRSCTWRQRKSRWRVPGSEARLLPVTGLPGSSASLPGKCRLNINRKRQTYDSLFKTLETPTQETQKCYFTKQLIRKYSYSTKQKIRKYL